MFKKSILSILAGIILSPLMVMAINITVPSAPGANYVLLSTTTGAYVTVATSSLGISGGGTPGGLDTQVQYNNGGVFGADSGLTYSSSTNVLSITGSSTGNTIVPLVLQNKADYSNGNGARLSFRNIFTGSSIEIASIEGKTITAGSLSGLIFNVGVITALEKMRLLSNGSLLIGTTTDNGLGLLQINGTSTLPKIIIPTITNSLLGTDSNGLVIATTTDFVTQTYASSTFPSFSYGSSTYAALTGANFTGNITTSGSISASKLTITGNTDLVNVTMANATSSGLALTGYLKDSTNATGTSAQVLTSTGTSTQWATPSNATITLSGDVTGSGTTAITTLLNTGCSMTDLTSNLTASGERTSSLFGTSSAGQLVNFFASTTGNGVWSPATAVSSTTASSTGMLGIALTVGTLTTKPTVVTSGACVRNDAWAFATGSQMYVATTTAGTFTPNVPTASGNIVRPIGYMVAQNILYFKPSDFWVAKK